MDFKEDTYDKIQRYLDNELKGEELRAFEAQLRADKSLAAEVELHREMGDFLEESGENELRKNLEKLGSEFTEAPNSKRENGFKYLLWLLPLLLLGGVFFYWNSINKNEVIPAVPTNEETQDSLSAPLIYAELPPFDSALIVWQPEYPPSTMVLSPDELINEDVFAPNRYLDSLHVNHVPSDSFNITIEKLPSDTVWIGENGAIVEGDLQIAATVQTPIDLMQETQHLYVYNNLMEQRWYYFDYLKPYKSNEKELVNIYRIDETIELNAEGLYYFILLKEDVFIGKIIVKQRPISALPLKGKKRNKKSPSSAPQPKDTLIYANDEDNSIPELKAPEFVPPKYSNIVESSASVPPPVLAANFEPNPALDLLMNNNVRSVDFELTVDTLTQYFELDSTETMVDFRLAATIVSSDDLLKKSYLLHLFSNDTIAYQNFTPMLTNGVEIVEKGEDEYVFDFQKSLTLPTGLYYVLLEKEETEQVIFVEKIWVRE